MKCIVLIKRCALFNHVNWFHSVMKMLIYQQSLLLICIMSFFLLLLLSFFLCVAMQFFNYPS